MSDSQEKPKSNLEEVLIGIITFLVLLGALIIIYGMLFKLLGLM